MHIQSPYDNILFYRLHKEKHKFELEVVVIQTSFQSNISSKHLNMPIDQNEYQFK